MAGYKYLIIGGGMAGDAAAKGIREVDKDGSIGIIGMEPDPPYKRPPLTKQLWKGKPEESIWLKTADEGVDLLIGRRIAALDLPGRLVIDEAGTPHAFEKLLIATGGTPRRLAFDSTGCAIYYRTYTDYKRLRAVTENKRRFAVIGGGFIGTEIAAALAMNDRQVVMIIPEASVGAKVYPDDLSEFLSDYYLDHGVELVAGDVASEIESSGEKSIVRTHGGREIAVDAIVAGIGIELNVGLAQAAGLDLDNGIVVDEFLRAGHPDVYAAGDVANFYNPALGKRIRLEHVDNATMMGKCAGRNMAGCNEPYHYLPFFYSDLFDLGYEAVGELNSQMEIFSDWKEPFQEGVVYYLANGRVRGVLNWNVWDKTDEARKLIAEPGPFSPDDLKGRIGS